MAPTIAVAVNVSPRRVKNARSFSTARLTRTLSGILAAAQRRADFLQTLAIEIAQHHSVPVGLAQPGQGIIQ